MDENDYLRAQLEAISASIKLNFPIIVGLEACGYKEEFLLFGRDAIMEYLPRYRAMRKELSSILLDEMPKENEEKFRCEYYFKLLEMITDIKNKYECAMIVCHPSCHATQEFYDLMDGCEIMNSGQGMRELFDSGRVKGRGYINQDAHSVASYTCFPCSDIDDGIEINTEEQLIEWIRSGWGNQ